MDHTSTSRADRARGLIEFLLHAQQLKTKANQVATVDQYRRDGMVRWLAEVPDHPAVHVPRDTGAFWPDEPLLVVDRIERSDPPRPDEELIRWLHGTYDDPRQAPMLRESITVGEGEENTELTADDQPGLRAAYEQWLPPWQAWAEQRRRDDPARELYNQLFKARNQLKDAADELELVVGTVLLAWKPSKDHDAVRRHLFTTALVLDYDDSGRISVRVEESAEPIKTELDMLDPSVVAARDRVNEVREQVRQLDAHPLDREEIGEVARPLVYALDANGVYRDEDAAAVAGPNATATFAPALILRRRSQRGLVEIFRTIAEQMREADAVPDGIVPLVDADYTPPVGEPSGEGALVTIGDEPFLPLPVNERQRRIIEAVDSKAQVLVQGPPGTGKTHTAAALLAHLLAQGKRVLITAQTDRALREVREKLPEQIKPLSVSVVGSSREDMAELKLAVQTIANAAHEYDADENTRVIDGCLAEIERLRGEHARTYQDILAVREREVHVHEHGDYRGTLAQVATRVQAEEPDCGWLAEWVDVGADDTAPLTARDLTDWREQLLDGDLAADELEARQRLLEPDRVVTPEEFARLVDQEQRAAAEATRYAPLKDHAAYDQLARLDATERGQLRERVHALVEETQRLAARPERWIGDALADVRAGRAAVWQDRYGMLTSLVTQCGQCVAQLGPLVQVELPAGQEARMATLAGQVRAYLAGGGSISTAADGTPKVGVFASKVLKQAQPLFDGARVDGLPPTTLERLDALLSWVEANRVLSALDKAWPENVSIPPEDTPQERLQWHRTELEQLGRVLGLAAELDNQTQRLTQAGLPVPNWSDLAAARTFAEVATAVDVDQASAAATGPLTELARAVGDTASGDDAGACVHRMRAAVEARDRGEYAAAHERLARLWRVRELVAHRDERGQRLAARTPRLHRAITSDPTDTRWTARLERFEQAWSWAATRTWVRDQEAQDINELQARLGRIDKWIRDQVEVLAARRAWHHAASPTRVTGTARADLTNYAQLVQRAGKLTGKYAARRRAEIQQAMDRCRPTVPVWILPIYRLAEQLRIQENMFDVVVVDEASQAGVEAVFLQYIAPKIVVIGDDKQVSPTVIVDKQRLYDLGAQYLPEHPYRAAWEDPERSLFDLAKMLYGGLITLTEHRRCVPEIIGFSNRIAYEPDTIRLLPVRQYGADRLDPIKPVYLPNGHEAGATGNKVNHVEADAIVDQIEKCLADPDYSGRTFGVISLLGTAQAKIIENKLLDRIGKPEWTARDLRCGIASDFQGSERDVIFLSMVAAPDPERRMAALTRDTYVQRYNVAVSRAKDQLWVFHSVPRSQLNNREDMRFQLLDYCYGVVERGGMTDERGTGEYVPEDERVAPFDSLFEQRVYNRILDRGYTVVPQYEAAGYKIDLVVVGGSTRLAVECDGDHWHGADAFEKDIVRQRDLERCGWRFFRVRESAFYVDLAAALAQLWEAIDDLDIRPVGETATIEPVDPGTSDSAPAEVTVDIAAPAEMLDVEESVGAAELAWPIVDVDATMDTEAPMDPASADGAHAVTAAREPVHTVFAPEVEPSVSAVGAEPIVESEPARDGVLPYEEFTGTVPPVAEASRGELIDGLRDIVAVEGPVVGTRLRRAYVRASGGKKVGKNIASSLDAAVTAAVRRGVLVRDNPLGASEVELCTYRRPDQPEVCLRERGPRPLEEVPPAEVTAAVVHVSRTNGWNDTESLVRATAAVLGIKRLTQAVREMLESVIQQTRLDQQGG